MSKVVIADVDGTLIAPDAKPTTEVSEKIVRTVADLVAQGNYFTLATARSLDWVEGITHSVKINAPLILDNGARIFDLDKNSYLQKYYLPPEKAKEVFSSLTKFSERIYFVQGDKRFTYNQDPIQNFQEIVKVMILHRTPDVTQSIYQELQKILDIKVTKSISGDNPRLESLHVTNFKASKEEAVSWLADYLKLDLLNFIGIGDSYNDIEFMKKCGLKITLENGVSEVKKIADHIVSSYDKDGVAQALEKYVLGSGVL